MPDSEWRRSEEERNNTLESCEKPTSHQTIAWRLVVIVKTVRKRSERNHYRPKKN